MKNSFNVEVNFSTSPTYSYEWSRRDTLIGVPVVRVSSSILKNVLTREGSLILDEDTAILSDGKNAVVIRLDEDKKITARSFLTFKDELDVAEYANNLKEKKVIFECSASKVHYERTLSIEGEMKKYLIERIEKCKDEYLQKYLYYLYCDDIKGYSKDKLITSIETSSIDKNMKVYKFLIES